MQPRQYDKKEFLHRVGTFFMLLGIGLIILFSFSEAANQPDMNYFCSGMVMLILAFVFRRRFRRPPPPSSGRGSGFLRWIKDPLSPLRRGGRGGAKKKAPSPEEDFGDDEFFEE